MAHWLSLASLVLGIPLDPSLFGGWDTHDSGFLDGHAEPH